MPLPQRQRRTDFDARRAAWQARGDAHDRAVRRLVLALPSLFVVAAAALAVIR